MVPSAVVILDEVPLTPVGKLDRKALPKPEFVFETSEYVPPVTPVEELVAEVYADVLGVERVGLTDGFFDLGGDSLVATRVVARVNSALNASIGVRDLFEEPTVGGLALAPSSRCRAPAPNGGPRWWPGRGPIMSRCHLRSSACGSSTGSIRGPAPTTSRWRSG